MTKEDRILKKIEELSVRVDKVVELMMVQHTKYKQMEAYIANTQSLNRESLNRVSERVKDFLKSPNESDIEQANIEMLKRVSLVGESVFSVASEYCLTTFGTIAILNDTIRKIESILSRKENQRVEDLRNNFFKPPFDLESIMLNPESDKEEILVNLNKDIWIVGFSTRTLNCLKVAGYENVGDVILTGRRGLRMMRNFGEKSVAEVNSKLNELGLKLSMEGLGGRGY